MKISSSLHDGNLSDVVVPDIGGRADDGHHGGLHFPSLQHRAPGRH